MKVLRALPVVFVLALLLMWYRQGFLSAATFTFKSFIALGLLAALVLVVQDWAKPNSRAALPLLLSICLILFVLWLTLIGAVSKGIDASAAVVAFLVAALAGRRPQQTNVPILRLPPVPSIGLRVALFIGVFWLTIGLLDWVAQAVSTRNSVAYFGDTTLDAQAETPPLVGMAFSGGGYRAALFHAGVMAELRERQVPIDIVSSVSGGSIFALALLNGISPERFVKVVTDGDLNLARPAVSPAYVFPAIVNALIPWDWVRRATYTHLEPSVSRTVLNSELIDRAFGQIGAEIPRDSKRPAWIIGTTDLRAAQIVGASAYGTLQIPIRPRSTNLREASGAMRIRTYGNPLFTHCRLDVWDAYGSDIVVAASAAFPLAFEPIAAMSFCKLDAGKKGVHSLPMWLVDGGVADNSGIVVLQALAFLSHQDPDDANLKRLSPSVVISSDASSAAQLVGLDLRHMSSDFGGAFSTNGDFLPSIGETADLLYSYSGAPFEVEGLSGPSVVTISPTLLMYRAEPGEYRRHLYLPDAAKVARLLMNMNGRERVRLIDALATSSDENARFTSELHTCAEAVRSVAQPPPDSVEKFAACLEHSIAFGGMFLRLDGLLTAFVEADTLKARFSKKEADDLFRLGRVMAIIEWSAISSQLTSLGRAVPSAAHDVSTP